MAGAHYLLLSQFYNQIIILALLKTFELLLLLKLFKLGIIFSYKTLESIQQ